MKKVRLKKIEDLMEQYSEHIETDKHGGIVFCYGIMKDCWDELLDMELTTYDTCAPYVFEEDHYQFYFPEWAFVEVETDNEV